MAEVYFTEEHEWIRIEGEEALVGISDYAQDQLGDIVFVELPETGRAIARGDEVAVVESVKAASEIYAPLAGSVTAVNDLLEADPGQVNSDPFGEGWFFRMQLESPVETDGLLSKADYDAYTEGLG